MLRTLLVSALALATVCAWGENAVTFAGRGNGPVTITEKDGTVRTVNLPNTAALEAQGKTHGETRAAEAKADADAAKAEAEAKKKRKLESQAQRKKDDEAKAKLAASQTKSLKEQEINQKKELAHYNDKDYTYGPGSAKKVDRTAGIVNSLRARRDEGGAASGEAGSAGPKITVGGETRIRYNHLSQ